MLLSLSLSHEYIEYVLFVLDWKESNHVEGAANNASHNCKIASIHATFIRYIVNALF